MPAIPPTTPPTIVPALDDELFDAGVGVAEPESEDNAEAALLEAEFVEDAAVEDTPVEDAAVEPDVTEAGLVVTTFPSTTHLPSFLVQQFCPFSLVGYPQQRLPSAQAVKGIHTSALLLPKSSVYPSCLSTVTGQRQVRVLTCPSHTQIEARWVRPCPVRAGVTPKFVVGRGNTKAVAATLVRVFGCNVSDQATHTVST